jgi:hypothetical protein
MENNKTMILSILGVLVLVIAVVGVSFAMYSFSAQGTKENVITTGSVSLAIDKKGSSLFTLDNAYGVDDATGIAGTSEDVGTGNFTLSANLSGTMNIHYEVGFTDLTQGNTNLTDSMIMVAIKDGSGNYYTNAGTTTTATAVTLNSFASNIGYADGDTGMNGITASSYLLNSYVFDKGIITTGGNIKTYTINAWISDKYVLKGGEESTGNVTTNSCTVDGKTTEAECTAAGGQWTTTQTKETTAESFSFKVAVKAAQY